MVEDKVMIDSELQIVVNIARAKRKGQRKIKLNKPILASDTSKENIPKLKDFTTISKIISLVDLNINSDKYIKFDSNKFTGWNSLEKFINNNYNIALIKNLYLKNNVLSLNKEENSEQIGYLFIDKNDALEEGRTRVTKIVIKELETKIAEELQNL